MASANGCPPKPVGWSSTGDALKVASAWLSKRPSAIQPNRRALKTQRIGIQAKSDGQRFTKADRLLTRAEFVHLAAKAPKIANRHFIAFFEVGPYPHCRLGITVSRKVGNAVTRNRIKRLAREFFRANRAIFARPWDIHVIAKKEAAKSCSRTIFISLEKLFRRIESFQND